MNLQMNIRIAENYNSKSQIARVVTENWFLNTGFCPSCASNLTSVSNNAKVHDFSCNICTAQFELKSFLGKTPVKINDGAYHSMIKRIMDIQSPHFIFLGYDKSYSVVNCFAVPNYLLQPSTIEKRKPLALTARRAGWIGCLIRLDQIPDFGKIKIVENGKVVKQEIVQKAWHKTNFLADQQYIETRGWTLDILNCIKKLNTNFTLNEIYQFEKQLAVSHPENKHIKDKIRQQLQVLRDRGFIDFIKPGLYKLHKEI